MNAGLGHLEWREPNTGRPARTGAPSTYTAVEAPKGEFGVFLVSNGSNPFQGELMFVGYKLRPSFSSYKDLKKEQQKFSFLTAWGKGRLGACGARPLLAYRLKPSLDRDCSSLLAALFRHPRSKDRDYEDGEGERGNDAVVDVDGDGEDKGDDGEGRLLSHVISGCSESRCPREGHFAILNSFNILHKDFIMPLHFIRCLVANSLGDILPTIRCVLIIHSQSPFKGFILAVQEPVPREDIATMQMKNEVKILSPSRMFGRKKEENSPSQRKEKDLQQGSEGDHPNFG
ncbi:hypothetical protein AgCh_009433 [Apium graveolens]